MTASVPLELEVPTLSRHPLSRSRRPEAAGRTRAKAPSSARRAEDRKQLDLVRPAHIDWLPGSRRTRLPRPRLNLIRFHGILREVWTSPELMLTLSSLDTGPRTAVSSCRLKILKRGEPDAALMRVTDGHTKPALPTAKTPASCH